MSGIEDQKPQDGENSPELTEKEKAYFAELERQALEGGSKKEKPLQSGILIRQRELNKARSFKILPKELLVRLDLGEDVEFKQY